MKAVARDAVIALVLFGCIPVAVKFVSANPYTIGIFRLAVAATGLAAVNAFRGDLTRLPSRDVGRLAIIGFFFFAHWLTFFIAIKASSASIGAIGLSTYGIHLLLLGTLFGRSRFRAIDAIAVALAAGGAILVVPHFELKNEIAFGMLLSCVSAVFYATLPILHQRWSHISSAHRALGQFSFALLYFLVFLPRTDWHLRGSDWAGLVFLAVGVTLIGHSLWVRVTTRLSPSLTSIIYYGNIPIAVALSVLILGEPLTGRMAVGAALIVAGGILGLAGRDATEAGGRSEGADARFTAM